MLNPWDLQCQWLLALVCLQTCIGRENALNKKKDHAKDETFGLTVTSVVRKTVEYVRLDFIFITASIDQYLGMFKSDHNQMHFFNKQIQKTF